MLKESSKKDIILVHNLEEADFLINNYMRRIRKNFIVDENKYSKYFEIVVDTIPINTVYKKNKLPTFLQKIPISTPGSRFLK